MALSVVEALDLDIPQGSSLTVDERKEVAALMLAARPEASDRVVAEWCGLSPKTVGAVRRAVGDEAEAVPYRVGRDGRRRPVDPTEARRRVADLLEADPGAPIRRVAAEADTSPATVLDVRRRLDRGDSPLPGRLAPAPPTAPDAALLAMPDGQQLTAWLDATAVDDATLERLAAAVPRGRVYVLADEARSRAAAWARFATLVESRGR